MGTKSRNLLKTFFKKGAYPTESQFVDLIDSFRHREEAVLLQEVAGLAEQLNKKYARSEGMELGMRVTESTEKIKVIEEKMSNLKTLFSSIADGEKLTVEMLPDSPEFIFRGTVKVSEIGNISTLAQTGLWRVIYDNQPEGVSAGVLLFIHTPQLYKGLQVLISPVPITESGALNLTDAATVGNAPELHVLWRSGSGNSNESFGPWQEYGKDNSFYRGELSVENLNDENIVKPGLYFVVSSQGPSSGDKFQGVLLCSDSISGTELGQIALGTLLPASIYGGSAAELVEEDSGVLGISFRFFDRGIGQVKNWNYFELGDILTLKWVVESLGNVQDVHSDRLEGLTTRIKDCETLTTNVATDVDTHEKSLTKQSGLLSEMDGNKVESGIVDFYARVWNKPTTPVVLPDLVYGQTLEDASSDEIYFWADKGTFIALRDGAYYWYWSSEEAPMSDYLQMQNDVQPEFNDGHTLPRTNCFFRSTYENKLFPPVQQRGPFYELDESLCSPNELWREKEFLSSLIDAAAEKLHQDEWDVLCGTYGKYDPENAPDAEHPYYLNEIWLTYQESLVVKAHYNRNYDQREAYTRCKARTNIPLNMQWSGSYERFAQNNTGMETAVIPYLQWGSLDNAFSGCTNLHSVFIGGRYVSSGKLNGTFNNCKKLVKLEFKYLNQSLNIADCSLISLESLLYIVTNATNTSVITITVHADVYAKLTGDTANDACAALSEAERQGWLDVLDAASDKNITFATL